MHARGLRALALAASAIVVRAVPAAIVHGTRADRRRIRPRRRAASEPSAAPTSR